MREFQNDDLIRLLTSDETTVRTLALNFLSEGYARDPHVLASVFAGWDRWGVDVAFPEFPISRCHTCRSGARMLSAGGSHRAEPEVDR